MQVKVISSKKNVKNDNFFTKVIHEQTKIVLGVEMATRETFYLHLKSAVTVGTTHELDMNMFDVVPKNVTVVIDGANKEIVCKQLYLKRV